MKRIFAFVLCLTMLLSQMAMVADAAQSREQSNLSYLEQNGIVVEDGGQIIIDDVPLGRSDGGEKYAPYVPKFIPEALKNLGLLPKDDKEAGVATTEEPEIEDIGSMPEIETIEGKINKESVMLYTGAGESYESVMHHNALGEWVEVELTPSVMWLRLHSFIKGEEDRYMYIHAEDVTLAEDVDYAGAYATDEENRTVQVFDAPEGAVVELTAVSPETAPPLRQVRGKNMGNRELIYACDITIRNPDGSEWQPTDGPTRVTITLPELPKLSERGRYYAEHVDAEGNVELLDVTRTLCTNMLNIETSGFSLFYIYTVDFTVNGLWHSIPGGSSIYMSELLTALQLEYAVEDIASVTFSDPELIEVLACVNEATGEPDWKLNSLKSFLSEEYLTLVLKNGERQVINVYDPTWTEWWDYDSSGKRTYIFTVAIGNKAGDSDYYEGHIKAGGYDGDGNDSAILVKGSKDGTALVNFDMTIYRSATNNVSHFWVAPANDGKSKDYKLVLKRVNNSTYLANPLFKLQANAMLVIEGKNADPAYFTVSGGGYTNAGPLVRVEGGIALIRNATLANGNRGTKGPGGAILTTGSGISCVHIMDAVIDNCHGTNGGAISVESTYNSPSDIHSNLDSTVRLFNVQIKNCSAKKSGDNTGCGGAIYSSPGARQRVYIWDSTFTGNSAEVNGGAIYTDGSTNDQMFTVGGCSFTGNSAVDGGAIYSNANNEFGLNRYQDNTTDATKKMKIYKSNGNKTEDYETVTITVTKTTTISGNTASNNGGAVFITGSTLDQNDIGGTTTIDGNTAQNFGGGLVIKSSTVTLDATINVTNNHTNNNIGGGVFLWSSATFQGYQKDASTLQGTLKVTGNTSYSSGGGIAFYYNDTSSTACTLGVFNKLTVSGNQAGFRYSDNTYRAEGANGGGIYLTLGTLTLNANATIGSSGSPNTAHKGTNGGNGGGIYVDHNITSFTTGGAEIGYNVAGANGGGIYAAKTFTCSDSTKIHHNKADGTGQGGGIYMYSAALTVGKSAEIYNNTTNSNHGGGIYSYCANLTLNEGAKIYNNTSSSAGGGIFIHAKTDVEPLTLTIGKNVEITGNVAKTSSGGGIRANRTNVSVGNGAKINGNSACSHGGGISIESSVTDKALNGETNQTVVSDLTLTVAANAEIKNNNAGVTVASNETVSATAAGANGGGIYLTKQVELTMSGGTIGNNAAYAGTDTSKSGTGFGGGIYIPVNAKANLNGGTISGNKAYVASARAQTGLGGGVYNKGTVIFDGNVTISGNHADRFGGGYYQADGTTTINSSKTVTINGTNNANDCGGGVNIYNGTFTNKGTLKVQNNTATNGGAGICMDNTETGAANTINGAGTFEITGNKTTKGLGGGVYICGTKASFTPTGSVTISSNEAKDGAGIYHKSGTLTLSGTVKILSNKASGNGGGLYTKVAWELTNNVKIGETEGTGNQAANGGGVYVDYSAKDKTFTISSGGLFYNTATGNGGGIYIATGTVNATGNAVLERNHADSWGGGAFLLSADSVMKWTDAGNWQVRYNDADSKGGGVFVQEGTLYSASSNNLNVYKNTANYGGGIYFGGRGASGNDEDPKVAGIDGSKDGGLDIYANTAKRNGGGIMVEACTLTFDLPVELSHNEATGTGDYGYGGGMYINAWSVSVTMSIKKNVSIYGNTATQRGGGMYITSAASKVTIENGAEVKVISGKTSEKDSPEAIALTAKGNSATDGGGVAISNSTLIIDGTLTVTNNSASGNGGGIYVGGTLTNNKKLSINTNTADNGGGIYVASGAFEINGTDNSTAINGNTATTNGGGIYTNGGTTTIKVRMHIDKNIATNGDGGGIYMAGGTINVEGARLWLEGNTAAKGNGGAINVTGTKATFATKTRAVTVDGTTTTKMGAITVTKGNTAINGGGIYQGGGNIKLDGNDISFIGGYGDASEDSSSFGGGNSATGTADGQGGGGAYLAGGKFSATKGGLQVGANTAKYGGGFYVNGGTFEYTSSAELEIGTFLYQNKHVTPANTATSNGGGIYIKTGTVSLSKAVIDGNFADRGGGIYIYGGSVTLSGGSAVQNHIKKAPNSTDAPQYGAGIYMYGGDLVLDNSTICDNQTRSNACGLCMNDDDATKTATLKNGASITRNHANGSAGGVWVNAKSTLKLQGSSTISENTATNHGGGIYMTGSGSKVEVSDKGNVVKQNNATNYGGGIYVTGSGTISIDKDGQLEVGQTDSANVAKYGGGMFVDNDGTATVKGAGTMYVRGNQASENGGGIEVYNGTFNLDGADGSINLYVEGNKAEKLGGGIIVDRNKKATAPLFQDTSKGVLSISENEASKGGGIYSDGTFTSDGNINVEANIASNGCGGGIYNDADTDTTTKNFSGTMTLGGGTICSNQSSANIDGSYGGGIVNEGEMSLTDCDIYNNTAKNRGAGIFNDATAEGLGKLTMSSCEVYSNTSDKNGGGILNQGLLEMTSCKIYSNTAKASGGGGIYNHKTDQGEETITFKGCEITGNIATGGSGGGIFNQGVLNFSDSETTVAQNNAKASGGGGIYSTGSISSTTTLDVNNNTAKYSGGGIRIEEGSLISTGTLKVDKNTASSNHGGGFYVNAATEFSITGTDNTISNNTTASQGGGLYATATATVTISNCEIAGNKAKTGHAGGIIMQGVSGAAADYKLNLTNCKVNENQCLSEDADSTDDDRGAGIYAQYLTLTISGGEIKSNTTKDGKGGGLYFNSTGALSISSCTISGNRAEHESSTNTETGCGGGIFIVNSGTDTNIPTITNSEISGNYAAVNGGGVYLCAKKYLNFTGTAKVFSNEAVGDGGGLYNAGTMTMQGGNIYGNDAGGNGGGIYNKGTFASTVKNLYIGPSTKADATVYLSNTAANGAGLYQESGSFSVSGTVSGSSYPGLRMGYNIADGDGGGIYLAGGDLSFGTSNHYIGYFNSGDAKVAGNQAANGAGMYLNGGTFQHTGGLYIRENVAATNGGGIFTNIGMTLGSGVTVSSNTAGSTSAGGNGGGIYINTGTVTVNSATISSNKAIAKAEKNGGGFGGGIYVNSGSTLDLQGGTLSKNKAEVSSNQSQTALGGGIYTNGTVKVTGSFTISGNTTNRYGGGIYQDGGDVTISEGVTLTVNGTNKADQRGGGIVVNGGTLENKGILIVQSNTAVNGGGGICMDNAGTIKGAGTFDISNNSATGTNATNSFGGGGVCIYGEKASFAPAGAVGIYENTSATNGGGVYLSNGSFKPEIPSGSTFNIRNNTTTGTGNGGGLYYIGGTFEPTGTTQFYGNEAAGNGGGIYTNVALALSGDTVGGDTEAKANKAGGNGGGIYVTASGSLESASSKIRSNEAVDGGGIYSAGGPLTFTTSHGLYYNTASNKGGGIYMVSGYLYLNTGSSQLNVQQNSAANGGGGLYFGGTGGTVEITSGVSEDNKDLGTAGLDVNQNTTSTGNGGGILIENCTVNSGEKLEIIWNTATAGDGGGIYMSGNSTLNLNMTTIISGNTAKTNGGGFYMADGTTTIKKGVDVSVNNAGHGAPPLDEQANSAKYGGGIYLNGGTLTNNGTLTIEKNTSTGHGGGLYITGGKLSVVGTLTVTGNSTGTGGGGIYMNGANAKVEGAKNSIITISDNLATNGGGLRLDNEGGSFTSTGKVEITGNKTRGNNNGDEIKGGDGGGIYMRNGTVSLTGNTTKIHNNYANEGGGIFIGSRTDDVDGAGIVVLSGGATVSNHTKKAPALEGDPKPARGGGVYMTAGELTLNSGATICNNHVSEFGGGIHMQNGGKVTLNNGFVDDNTSGSNGAGICMNGTAAMTVTMSNGASVSRNTSTDENTTQTYHGAGGFWIGSKSTLTLEGDTTISGNKATNGVGGGVYFSGGGTLIVKGSNNNIVGNIADTNGGGIYLYGSTAKVDIQSDATLTVGASGAANTAVDGGGIYFNGGTATANGTLNVGYNTASGNGGGVYAGNAGKITGAGAINVYSNTAVDGAGMYLTNDSFVFEATGTMQFYSNEASGNGGGIYSSVTSFTISSKIKIGCVADNTNKGNSAQNGGGIYVASGTVTTKAASILYNTATADGGGVYINTGASLENSNDTSAINYNNAQNDGGGIYSNGTITNNNTLHIRGNSATKHGGGIYTAGAVTTTGMIVGGSSDSYANTATYGGGIYIKSGTFSAFGGGVTVQRNRATYGGGVYMLDGTLSWQKNEGGTNGNWTVADNVATGNGGGIYINSGSVTTDSGWELNVRRNQATNGGGIYIGGKGEDGTDLTVKEVIFEATGDAGLDLVNNVATGNGGGIMAELCNVSLGMKAILSHNQATNGGNLALGAAEKQGVLTISYKLYAYGGVASDNGGGIYMDSGASATVPISLTINSGAIVEAVSNKSNDAEGDKVANSAKNGGGIYVASGTFTNSGTLKVNDNTSTNDGGGIYLASGASFTSSGTLNVNSNTADTDGGGIYTNGATKFSITGSNNKLNNNTAAHQGGAVYAKATVVEMTNCKMDQNVAQKSHAGGIIILDSTSASLENCNITKNTCGDPEDAPTGDDDRGAGIYAQNVELTIIGGSIENNSTPYGKGGGIYFNSSGKKLMIKDGCVISGNQALRNRSEETDYGGDGGGIYVNSGELEITGATISGNHADRHGGGIYTKGNATLTDTTVVTGNSAGIKDGSYKGQGGGIYIAAKKKTLTVDGGSISGNFAYGDNGVYEGRGYGGGIYVGDGVLAELKGSGVISGNTAYAAGDAARTGLGGGIYTQGTITVSEDFTISGNNASRSGGGIFQSHNEAVFTISEGVTLTVNGSNTAKDGGGINLYQGALTNNGTLDVYGNVATHDGGGIYVYRGIFTAGTLNVYENTATNNGAGICFMGGTFNDGDLNVYKNTAGNYGGGIYVEKALTLTGDTIGGGSGKENKAAHGGGIFAVENLTLNAVKVTYNLTTNGHGGGIYMSAGSLLTLGASSSVSSNSATHNGGGIYLSGKSNLTCAGKVTINSNKTDGGNGGGIYVDNGTFTSLSEAKDSSLNSNSASGNGGGLYVNTGTADFQGKFFIQSNEATNGGGICNNEGTVYFQTNISMRQNSAKENGGAIYNNKTFTVSAGDLWIGSWHAETENTGNVAKNGAAIYQNGGTFTLGGKGVYMADNRASQNGGGIYVKAGEMKLEPQSTGNFNIGALYYNANVPKVAGNKAGVNKDGTASGYAGNGGGIYLEGGTLTVVSTRSDYGLRVAENFAYGNGGGLCFVGGTLSLGNGTHYIGAYSSNSQTYTGNKAGANGGGIYCSNTQITLNDKLIVTGNYAGVQVGEIKASATGGNGGGICLTGTSSMTMAGGTLSGNYAYAPSDTSLRGGFGGGLFVDANASADLSGGGVITGNYAKVDSSRSQTALGGGIYTKGDLTFSGAFEISANGSDRYGGGLLQAGGTVTINTGVKVDVKTNDAPNGAGVSSSGGTLNVNGTLEVHDNTGSNGAGIGLDGTPLIQGGGTLNVHDNVATGNGGGFWMVTYSKTSPNSNRLKMSGTVLITGNQAANGGGIFISSGNVTLNSKAKIEGNAATKNGGGIYMTTNGIKDEKGVVTDVTYGTVALTGTVVNSNQAVNGGGVYSAGGSLTLSDSAKIEANTATGNGGGIYMDKNDVANSDKTVASTTTGTVTLNGSAVSSNQAQNGGGIYMVAGTVEMQGANSKIEGNTATTSGGGVYMANGTLELTNSASILSNSATDNGGGVYVVDGQVTVNSGTVQGNKTDVGGGGIYMTGGTATVNGSTIDGNFAKSGGGAYLIGGTLNVTGGSVISNHKLRSDGTTPIYNGGGICMTNGTVNIDGASEIKDNVVHRPEDSKEGGNGGGVNMSGGTLNLLGGSKITGNTASYGGGICGGGTVNVTDSFISGNTASGTGGGIFVSGSTVTLNGTSEIRDNQANGGGGVRITSGSIELKDTTKIVANRSTSTGGGVHMGGEKGGTLKLSGNSAISENTAATTGGGVSYEKGSITISGTPSIFKNTAAGNGGGIYAAIALTLNGALTIGHATDSTLGNSATGAGGGIYAAKTLNVTGIKVMNNTSHSHGGGIYVAEDVTSNSATLGTGTEIAYNKALKDSADKAKHGGGIYAHTSTVTVSDGVNIHHNEATSNGGGAYIYCGSMTLGNGVTVQNNTAGTNGGGIFIYDEGTGTMPTLTVGANSVISDNTATGAAGGGIYARLTNVIIGESVKLQNNTAGSHGGAIYSVENAGGAIPKLTVGAKSVISDNNAGNNGGGIYTYLTDVTLNAGVNIYHNNAGDYGGGIYMNRRDNAHVYDETTKELTVNRVFDVPVFTVNGTQDAPVLIQENTSGKQGGGVYAYNYHARVDHINVSDNTSGQMGGGWLLVSYASRNLTKTVNDVQYVYKLDNIVDSAQMECTIKNSIISNNVSGSNAGGLYAEGYGKTTLEDSTFSDNETTGYGGGILLSMKGYAPTISGCTISGNEATKYAGGIYITTVTKGVAQIRNNTITDNSAKTTVQSEGGGGIYLTGVSANISGCTISNNHTGSEGGGICVKSNSTVTVASGSILDNTATYGGGIYATNSTVNITGGEIKSNDATHTGGGLYLYLASSNITGGEISENTAKNFAGGVYVGESSTLTVSGVTKSPIRNNVAGVKTGTDANWDSAAGNDIYALGNKSTVIMPATSDNGAAEYWYADYKENDSFYPGQPVFPSAYKDANGKYIHFGRYDEKVTPVTYARRSFGGTSTEAGAADASKAVLALTLSTKVQFMDLTLTKNLAAGEKAVENTTFIFYIKGVDDASFQMPVTINLAKDATQGTVTITGLPVGVYDICEDESWSWRYLPSSAVSTNAGSSSLNKVANGDDYIRVVATASSTATPAITFTNGIENYRWLTDAKYIPFLAPTQAATGLVSVGDDEDNEETSN